MKRIKFMEEYGCWALWHMDYAIDGEMGNIDPHELSISSDLAEKINEWSISYDKTLNQEYPPYSGFDDYESAQNFINIGNELVARLQNELGNNFSVVKEITTDADKLVRMQQT